MTEESLSRFADKLTALYSADGEIEVWLDSLEDLTALEKLFQARGCQAEVNTGKQTLWIKFA
ncbi:MAG: hypothetical protein ACHQ50_03360 [Fimbriimonadales bacterium]